MQKRILISTKSVLTAAVHDKMLRLSSETLEGYSVQDVLSRDVGAIVKRSKGMLALLESGFIVSLGIALLYRLIGLACFAAMASTAGM